MKLEEIKSVAAEMGSQLSTFSNDDGIANEVLPPLVREQVIALRQHLIRRGIYDPVLGRFDSHTVPQITVSAAAARLKEIAAAL
jgi:hypothetical protein